MCYIGTSAGALNAAVLASADTDTLLRFWTRATSQSILGTRVKSVSVRYAAKFLSKLFSVYGNTGLRELVASAVNYGTVVQRKAHLIIAATNYTSSALRAFYISELIDQFVQLDALLPPNEQRMSHFRAIDSQNKLENCLLASAAIPLFFPPVQIDGDWYVDGGIGNHTPTREAAYFLRHCATNNVAQPGVVYCVKQDPPRAFQDTSKLNASEILKRTLEIYHYIHTEPIVHAWSRINEEVRDHETRMNRFSKWLAKQPISPKLQATIDKRFREELGKLGGATARHQLELIEIEPSDALGDTLDFDRKRIRKTIERGYLDTLNVLKIKGMDSSLHQKLVNQPLFGK